MQLSGELFRPFWGVEAACAVEYHSSQRIKGVTCMLFPLGSSTWIKDALKKRTPPPTIHVLPSQRRSYPGQWM